MCLRDQSGMIPRDKLHEKNPFMRMAILISSTNSDFSIWSYLFADNSWFAAPGRSLHRMRGMGWFWQRMVVVTTVATQRATRAYTPWQSIWGCSNYVSPGSLPQTDGRGTAATKRPSRYTYVASTGLLPHRRWSSDRRCVPPAPRDLSLSRINVRTKAARKSGSCGNRAAPLLSSFANAPILEAAGWSLGVTANAIYLSSCSSRSRRRDG